MLKLFFIMFISFISCWAGEGSESDSIEERARQFLYNKKLKKSGLVEEQRAPQNASQNIQQEETKEENAEIVIDSDTETPLE